MSDAVRALAAVGLPPDIEVIERHERPHGLVLRDNAVVCWGKADDWKLVLLAAHERAFARSAAIKGVVLLPPLTRYLTKLARAVVENAALKLGTERLAWHDPHDQLDSMNVLATRTRSAAV